MIRTKRLSLTLLNSWLSPQKLEASADPKNYSLRLWREQRTVLNELLPELRLYIEEGFADAKRKLRRGFEDSLSPFHEPSADPAAHYPAQLHRVTLQGYWGETLAAIAVEHWGALGHTDWVVPAFLFRMHEVEFQHLESIRQRNDEGGAYEPDNESEKRPGRTGDDVLALRMDGQGRIIDVLTLEAKCLNEHRTDVIKEAHHKLSKGDIRPPGVRELINILDEYDTPEANQWKVALLKLWQSDHKTCARHDGLLYAIGNLPVKGARLSWMSSKAPHSAYTLNRQLNGMEIQFDEVNNLIDLLYRNANDG